ncbi:helix-turn-helix domain-containing protein [Lysinibacillus sp. NPDC047702]|uniref:helix-turn-helix domain-containing protein n=1 Tax=unclassified Lysinibacillus TaxID=2636778 RepID=UPI003D054CA7
MNNFGEYLKSIRAKKSLTINQLSLYSGISSSQLSRIETGKRGVPKPPTIEKLAHALKIDYNELMKAAGYIDYNGEMLPPLTEKDEKDLKKDLEKVLNGVDSGSYANYDGLTLDDLDEEDRELLLASIENSMRLAKRLAKKKFTPKKYRVDKE